MEGAHTYLALDLGAESGRAIIGKLSKEHLSITEVHRFSNTPVRLNDGLHWDVLRLWSDIKEAIGRSSLQAGNQLESIGLDSWGVDFGLLDGNGVLLSNPLHHRDERTDGILDEAFKIMPKSEIFANSGIQFMQINTVYQLLSMVKQKSSLYEVAKTFVTIPDLFNYWLSGEITNEFTNATTTQCFDPRKRAWSVTILDAFGIPSRLFQPVTESGTRIGTLLPGLAEETGAGAVPIMLPACHDTGSAVVAVPAKNPDFAWLSSGTWSIMGVESSQPVINDQALEYNFTNEGGVFGTWRFSKNVMGLWLVQECRREWMRRGEEMSFGALTQAAAESEAFLSVIDPDYVEFLHPGDMPSRIQSFCAETDQQIPQSKGQIIRVALEAIALKYRLVLERLEELTGKHLNPIHIIGGGTKNRLLNQFTADSTGRTVITGPIEATAIGNMLMQAIGLKHLTSLAEARELVSASFGLETYEPKRTAGLDEAYARLRKVMK